MRPIIIGGADANTLLLLKGSVFEDSSQYNQAITNVAGLIDNADPVPSGAFGEYYDLSGNTTGTAKRIDVAQSGGLVDFFNRNFTLEFWGQRQNTGAAFPAYFFSVGEFVSSYIPSFAVRIIGSTGALVIERTYGATTDFLSSHTITDADWHHYAITRDGDDWVVYVDGVAVYTSTLAQQLNTTTADLHIGGWRLASSVFGMIGRVDDLRLSQVVRYFGDFTPPGPHKR